MLETLDIRNFLGGFAIWLFIALCVSIYSRSPFQAALHVFLFFIGMVGSYYLYSHYIAGFFPQSYALIWIGLTALSPFLGYICWYASGNGTFAILLSAGILSVFINTAFAYGAGYIDLKSELELFVLILSLIVLRRRSIKEMILLVVLACLFAILFRFISPFQFW
ncbi:hypothetical protein [Listeria floridensis]|uniref:hypothetical protein n=1 Tax=Listeria floridensis TaxID=1494962 RepID=UPI001F4D0A89|nr:hypothetical protein [Listeria floridensis]